MRESRSTPANALPRSPEIRQVAGPAEPGWLPAVQPLSVKRPWRSLAPAHLAPGSPEQGSCPVGCAGRQPQRVEVAGNRDLASVTSAPPPPPACDQPRRSPWSALITGSATILSPSPVMHPLRVAAVHCDRGVVRYKRTLRPMPACVGEEVGLP